MAIQTVQIAALQKDGGTVSGPVDNAEGYNFIDCGHHN